MRKSFLVLSLLALTTASALAQPAAQPDNLIRKMAANENQMLAEISKDTPLVETYLQVVAKEGELPISDRYYLHRIDLGKSIHQTMYEEPAARHSRLAESLKLAALIYHRAPLSFDREGFIETLSPDIHGFDPANYSFTLIRKEFLGKVRTSLYDVKPIRKAGYFRGRLWIDDAGNLVRFTGSFATARDDDKPRYVHFDSWRTAVKGGHYLPAAVYIEEPVPGGTLHGQVRIWGYGIEASLLEDSNISISIDNAEDHSGEGSDVDPITAMRQWRLLASRNILEKMERTGILAPHGDFDKVLDQIVVNLEVPNQLAFAEPVTCRIMLTTPLEATTVGNTIILSRGLLETLPSEEAIASVVAFEIAHIAKGMPVDTRFSFADRTMFADREVSRELTLKHTAHDDATAASYAVELLGKSMYADKLASVSLYLQQLNAGIGRLKSLYQPEVGDSLVAPDGRPWLFDALAPKGPRLAPADMGQVAALPLGSNLAVDSWSGSIRLSQAPRYQPMSPAEKMPFAVTPVYYRLQLSTGSSQTAEHSGSTSNGNTGGY